MANGCMVEYDVQADGRGGFTATMHVPVEFTEGEQSFCCFGSIGMSTRKQQNDPPYVGHGNGDVEEDGNPKMCRGCFGQIAKL